MILIGQISQGYAPRWPYLPHRETVVASGPFQGMRYACAQSFGSALLPKLIGSYAHLALPFAG